MEDRGPSRLPLATAPRSVARSHPSIHAKRPEICQESAGSGATEADSDEALSAEDAVRRLQGTLDIAEQREVQRVSKVDSRTAPGRGPLRYLAVSALSLTQRPPKLLLRWLPRRHAKDFWRALQILVAFLVALWLMCRKPMGFHTAVEDLPDVQKIADLQLLLRKLPPLWPAPRQLNLSLTLTRVLDAHHFRITSNTHCDVLSRAIVRYRKLTLLSSTLSSRGGGDSGAPTGVLNCLHVEVRRHRGADCGYPPPKANESYTLEIPARGDALLTSETVWGALRGLETFSQVVLARPNQRYAVVNCGEVRDFPRFSHRGILMDTARHFLPVAIIKQNLDAMAYNKFNVLHWHLVDDQSWPLHLKALPNLTARAAYSKRHVYSEEDLRGVVEYARLRGIRVIPEIDTPGHTQALGRAFPDVLTPCYGNGTRGSANLGQYAAFEILDPTKNATYSLVQSIFSQVAQVFRDPYLHLGMDEVYYDCWKSSPEIRKFQSTHGLSSASDVEQHYVRRTIGSIVRSGVKVIIWQDPIQKGVKASPNATVVQIWKGYGWTELAATVARRGYELLVSSCWYLDLFYNNIDWAHYYACDPRAFSGTPKEKRMVLGGEACMWAEYVDRTNLLSSLWPRASAVAERLWSSRNLKSAERAAWRLNAHRCRMLRRGIPVHPLNSMSCENDEELDFRDVFETD